MDKIIAIDWYMKSWKTSQLWLIRMMKNMIKKIEKKNNYYGHLLNRWLVIMSLLLQWYRLHDFQIRFYRIQRFNSTIPICETIAILLNEKLELLQLPNSLLLDDEDIWYYTQWIENGYVDLQQLPPLTFFRLFDLFSYMLDDHGKNVLTNHFMELCRQDHNTFRVYIPEIEKLTMDVKKIFGTLYYKSIDIHFNKVEKREKEEKKDGWYSEDEKESNNNKFSRRMHEFVTKHPAFVELVWEDDGFRRAVIDYFGCFGKKRNEYLKSDFKTLVSKYSHQMVDSYEDSLINNIKALENQRKNKLYNVRGPPKNNSSGRNSPFQDFNAVGPIDAEIAKRKRELEVYRKTKKKPVDVDYCSIEDRLSINEKQRAEKVSKNLERSLYDSDY